MLRYIDNFVAALATARILIALRSVALIFYDGAVLSAAMVAILALLLPPVARITIVGGLVVLSRH
ncbi:hypothetical protein [uncultured Campylobacter sp.]|uniref:hypothetical protein n=1 Tax=uncultured Campylobacter sp. TaxID=218934 RepID=UPI0026267A88|nr:hypothetical protein [uncultured Campylobacter sp.]